MELPATLGGAQAFKVVLRSRVGGEYRLDSERVVNLSVQYQLYCLGEGYPAVGHFCFFVGAFATFVGGQFREVTRQVDAACFAGCAGAAEVVGQSVPGFCLQVCLFSEFALRGDQGVFTVDIEQSGGYFPEVHAHRVAVLVEHQQFVVVVEDRHGDGAGHFHDVAGQHGVFVEFVLFNGRFDHVAAVLHGAGADGAFGGCINNLLVVAHSFIVGGFLAPLRLARQVRARNKTRSGLNESIPPSPARGERDAERLCLDVRRRGAPEQP